MGLYAAGEMQRRVFASVPALDWRAALDSGDRPGVVGVVSGMAALFGVRNRHREELQAGAFAGLDLARLRFLLQHDTWQVLGPVLECREDAAGLVFTGGLADTAAGRDTRSLCVSGALNALSIGFMPVEWEVVRPPDEESFVRLRKVDLWEVSLVTWGSLPGAVVSEVRGAPGRGRAGAGGALEELERMDRQAGAAAERREYAAAALRAARGRLRLLEGER